MTMSMFRTSATWPGCSCCNAMFRLKLPEEGELWCKRNYVLMTIITVIKILA